MAGIAVLTDAGWRVSSEKKAGASVATEGHSTRDLMYAKALLKSLAAIRKPPTAALALDWLRCHAEGGGKGHEGTFQGRR